MIDLASEREDGSFGNISSTVYVVGSAPGQQCACKAVSGAVDTLWNLHPSFKAAAAVVDVRSIRAGVRPEEGSGVRAWLLHDIDLTLRAPGNTFELIADLIPFRPYFTSSDEAVCEQVQQLLPADIGFH